MKRVLVYGEPHRKNKNGLYAICKYLGYQFCTYLIGDASEYDIIYCPFSASFDEARLPNVKFIYGPQFCVLPDRNLLEINNILNNCVYIQPSEWAKNCLEGFFKEKHICRLEAFPFPVDTELFKPSNNVRDKVLIYYKKRHPEELFYLINFLYNKKIEFTVINYENGYQEDKFIEQLKETKYVIYLGIHESQGFALEEMLSMNVPLLVWSVTDMSQEYKYNYPKIPATTVPYWDKRCGEVFYKKEDLQSTFDKFLANYNNYRPRDYILENLSVEKCSERFLNLIK